MMYYYMLSPEVYVELKLAPPLPPATLVMLTR